MDDAVDVPPPAGGAAEVPVLRLRGKTAPAAADDAALRVYLSDLRAWLLAQPEKMATGAAVMRYLRTRRGFRDFVRRNVRYGRAENLVFASDTLELLPGSGAFNPRIRAKADVAPVPPAPVPPAPVPPAPVPPAPVAARGLVLARPAPMAARGHAPMAERGPVLAPGVKKKAADAGPRPLPAGGGLGAALLRGRAAG